MYKLDYGLFEEEIMKGVMRFGKKGKLASRYIEPFEIQSRVDEVAGRLVLPLELSWTHPKFSTY